MGLINATFLNSSRSWLCYFYYLELRNNNFLGFKSAGFELWTSTCPKHQSNHPAGRPLLNLILFGFFHFMLGDKEIFTGYKFELQLFPRSNSKERRLATQAKLLQLRTCLMLIYPYTRFDLYQCPSLGDPNLLKIAL